MRLFAGIERVDLPENLEGLLIAALREEKTWTLREPGERDEGRDLGDRAYS